MKKLLKVFISAIVLSLIFTFAPSVSAAPHKGEAKPPQDFTACVDREKTGAVIVLMDESQSVYKSDPLNNRLQGVQIFIDELADLATYHQSKVQVKLAGMGASYQNRSGGWQTLEKGSDGAVSSLKSSAQSTWNGKSGSGYSNKEGTDIWGALDGVKQDFNTADVSCKLLIFFKDGADWHYYARTGEEVKLPEAQELRDQGKWHEADEIASEDICRGLGVADSLRSSDIYLVAAGLGDDSPEKFQKLQALAEGNGVGGYSCGDETAKGSFVQVKDVSSLQQDFASALEGKVDVKQGSLNFRLSPGLTSIRIVSSALTSSYKIIPPAACNGSGATNIDTQSAQSGTFGQAVNWSRTTYGETGAGVPASIRVVIKHDFKSTDYSCWSGAWNVKASPSTLTSLKFDANLKAVVKFDEDAFNPVLFPGKSQDFKVILQRIDDPSVELNPEDINSDLDYYAEASLYAPNGDEVDKLFDSGEFIGGQLPKRAFFTKSQTLSIAKNYPIGTYKIRITLFVKVLDSDIDLLPMQTETPVKVGSVIKAPEVIRTIQLGTISGASPTTGTITVKGTDRDTCILLDQGEVKLTAAPSGVSYELGGECAKVPAGQTVDISFKISPKAGSKPNAVGSVDGYLMLKAQVIGSESTQLPMPPAKFTGRQDAAPNEEARWLLIAFFMLMSGLLSYLLLVVLSRWVAKFPAPKAVTQRSLQSISLAVQISRYEIKPLDGSMDSKLDNLDSAIWTRVEKNRRVAYVSGIELAAKSSGLRLASAGFSEVTGDQVGIGGPAVSGSPTHSSRPILGLSLQNSWFIQIPRSELQGKVADDSFSAIGQLVVLVSAHAPLDQKLRLVSDAESTISQRLERLIALSSQSEAPAKSSKKASKPQREKSKKSKVSSTSPGPESGNTEAPTSNPFDF